MANAAEILSSLDSLSNDELRALRQKVHYTLVARTKSLMKGSRVSFLDNNNKRLVGEIDRVLPTKFKVRVGNMLWTVPTSLVDPL